jgi:tetratricopeptide (TPR) repeat protein
MFLEMTELRARHLLTHSRELHWAFPSSQGTPIIRGHPTSRRVEQAAQDRESYANAARVMLKDGDNEDAIELASNVWRLWIVARDLKGGREFLAGVLDKGRKKPSRALSLASYGDSLFAHLQGKVEESRERSHAALEAALVVNDREALALANLALARVAMEGGDYAKSQTLAVKARDLARDLDPALGQAPLFLHAQATRMLGDYDKAAELIEQNLELNRKINDQGMVIAELQNLGWVEAHRGHFDKAERCFTESEKLESANDPYSMAMTILGRAFIAFGRGDKDQARTLLTRAQDTFREAKISPGPDDQFEINWIQEQLKDKIRD